jgi:hypothetical protein
MKESASNQHTVFTVGVLPTELPFTGLNQPDGVGVGHECSVYIADADNPKVLKLVPGGTSQSMLVSTGLKSPEGVPGTRRAASLSPTPCGPAW